MTLFETFNARMKDAMKRRDANELALLRMVKSRFQLKLSEKGVAGPLTDEMALDIIQTYVKQLSKSIPEFEKAGERGVDKIAHIRFEIDYQQPFLPQMMDEAATRKLVEALIAELGLSQPGDIGRLMGAVMKNNKGQVDPGLTKKLATQLLTAS